MGQKPPKTSTSSRAERKEMTKAEAKAGKLAPAGQATEPSTAASAGPTTTRMERKAATKAAAKAGKLTPAGEAAMPVVEPAKK